MATDEIFISYSRKDEKFAGKLAIWLAKTFNTGVWIDIEDIPPGVKWSQAIQEGLDDCKVMIVIMSPEAMESINVEDEWQYFLDQGKPVIPILLRSVAIPYQLRRIQYIDFSVREEYSESLRLLVSELRLQMNPLEGEERDHSAGHRHAAPIQSRRDMKGQETGKGRGGWMVFLMGLLVGIIVVMAGVIFLLLNNQSNIYIASLGGNNSAQIYFPDSDEPKSLSDVSEIPAGSHIVTNGDTIQLASNNNETSAVLYPESDVQVGEFADAVTLGLSSGSVSVDSTDATSAQVQTAYGININLSGENMEVEIDPEDDSVRTDCYEGSCVIDDGTKQRVVNEGESLTFDGDAHDFDTAEVAPLAHVIVFITNRHGASEIYIMNADGENEVRLTNNTSIDNEPVWSPRGRKVAFVSTRNGNQDIYVMNADGSNVVQLTTDNAIDVLPAFSPDGSRIAFVSNRDGDNDIYVMDTEGSNIIQLTDNDADDTHPTWSPGGGRIAFVSNRDGIESLYILDVADGVESEVQRIMVNENPYTTPAWSPDGSKIAFTVREFSNLDVYVANIDGTNLRQITTSSTIDTEPSWSPDGSQIIYTSQQEGNYDLFVASVANPSNYKNITNHQDTADREPSWLPARVR